MAAKNADLAKKFKLPEEQISQLRSLFKQFDRDNDGVITAEEIHAAMKSTGSKLDLAVAQNIMRGADGDGDGKMDFTEFVAALAPKFKVNEDNKLHVQSQPQVPYFQQLIVPPPRNNETKTKNPPDWVWI